MTTHYRLPNVLKRKSVLPQYMKKSAKLPPNILNKYIPLVNENKRAAFEAAVAEANRVRYRAANLQEWQESDPNINTDPLVGNPLEIPDEDLELLEHMGFTVTNKKPLGSGAFGIVMRGLANSRARRYLSTRNSDDVQTIEGYPVAVKFMLLLWDQDVREHDFLSQLSHPNIIHIYTAVRVRKRLYIVMEYCPHGSLRDFLFEVNQGREVLTTGVCLSLIRQMTTGLLYLHDNLVVHGDLHENNIMLFKTGDQHIDNENRFLLKYIDFGLTIIFQNWADIEEDISRIGLTMQFVIQASTIERIPLRDELEEASIVLLDSDPPLRSLRPAIIKYPFLHPIEHIRLVHEMRRFPGTYAQMDYNFPDWFVAESIPPLLQDDVTHNIQDILNELDLDLD